MRWFNAFVSLENKFFKEMKAAHKEIEKEIIENLGKLKVDEEGVLDLGRHKVGIDDLLDAENSVERIEGIGWEMISEIFEIAGERASKEVRDFLSEETKKVVTTDLDYSFNINSPKVIKYIDSRSISFARESIDTILQSLRLRWNAYLKTGIKSRITVGELTEKIQEIFRGTERETWSRARLIARTETVGAANQASLMTYQDAGIPRKMWVSSRDPLVRDSHEVMDGVIVNSSENFIVNGKSMNGPGDPKGGPAETCNCRCTILPIFAES